MTPPTMDIRRYRLLRQQQREQQQQRESCQALPPLPPASSPTTSSSTTQFEVVASAQQSRRAMKLPRMMVPGRKSKQHKGHIKSTGGDEIEVQSLINKRISSDQLYDDDSMDDYSNDRSQSSTATATPTNPTTAYSLFPFNLLKFVARSPRLSFVSLIVSSISILIAVIFVYRITLYTLALRLMSIPPGLYSRDGHLYVGKDTRFFIKGVSWFGMEEDHRVPRGLDKVSIDNVFAFLKEHRFNAIRLPMSLQNLKHNSGPGSSAVSTFLNPELKSLHYIDVIRVIVRKAAEHNILVLLDMHRLQNDFVQSEGVWYNDKSSEQTLEKMWLMVAKEFSEEWNIVGVDLYNEPWNATWTNDPLERDNWKHMAESLGNKIHEICPSWLLFVEGVGSRAGSVSSGCFWSENLHAMQETPPQFKIANKVVLSPHVYGPSVFMQEYFKSSNFTDDMPEIWDDHFGAADIKTGFATVIGEWGGTFKGIDASWQKKFYAYIMKKELSFFYWCLNPESGDTGGLLLHDWQTPETAKLNLLASAPSSSVDKYKAHFMLLRG